MTCTRIDSREIRALVGCAGGLETLADTGRRWGLSKTRMHQYAAKRGFPTPVATIASGRVAVYLGAELDAWRNRRGSHVDVVHRRDEGPAPAAD